MSAVRIFVPIDAAARSVGADETAAAIAAEAQRRKIDIELVRNGSRGLLWLEPLVEVEIAGRRLAYGPVAGADVPSLFDAGFASPHPKAHGPTEEIPYLKRQQRLTFARVGITDPKSLSDYLAARRLPRTRRGAGAETRRYRRERHRLGFARARRRRVPGRNQMADRAARRRGRRSTSCAMPTRAIRAPSRIAC